MNIWLISKYASIPQYGAAARLFFLAVEFKKQFKNVLLLTSDSNHLCQFPDTDSNENHEYRNGVHICWVKTLKYKRTASIARILSWFDFELGLFRLKREKFPQPDVIVVSSLSLLSFFFGYYCAKKYKAKFVFEVRDIWPLTLTEEGGFSKWHPLTLFLAWVEKKAYQKSDLIVGTMPRLDLHVKILVKQQKEVFCSPLGIEDSLETAVKPYEELDLYFPTNKKIIGYAGSMGISNGLDAFMQCILDMQDKHDIFFVLVGDGDLRNDYMARMNGCNNVVFVPKIPQKKVQYFLSKCDILYLATAQSKVWDYGQSMNKVVQYMLSGKPIIASYSGYPSMINEADAGVFVDVCDSLKLSQRIKHYSSLSKEELSEIGLRGREWILNNRKYSLLAKQYAQKIFSLKD